MYVAFWARSFRDRTLKVLEQPIVERNKTCVSL